MWNIGDSVLWFTGQNVHFGHIRWIRGGDEVVGVYFTEDVGDNPGVLGSIENGAVKLVRSGQLKLVSKAPGGAAQPGQSVPPPTYGATPEDYGTSGSYTEAVFTRESYQQPTKANFPQREVSHSSNEDSSVYLKKRVANEDKALSETIQFLIKRDGSASLDSVSRKLEYQPEAFHRFLKKKHQVFKLEKKDDAIDVKLNVELCQDYWTTSGCVTVKCNRFHICRNFILGTCNEKTNRCLFGHKFNTKQNLKARNAHGLGHIDEDEIEQLVCNMEGLVQAPLVCLDYNSGDCQKIDSKCKSMHICVRLVMGTCSDENACSVRNHDIRKKECIAILEKRGIETNQSPKELFTIIKQKINNSADVKAFTSGTSKSSRSNVGQGDVNNEICCDFISGKCSRGCSMMHSKKIFQWQIRHPINHAWLNLQPFHSYNIEAHFRNPSLDSYIIDVMDSKKVESEGKPIFEVLGTQRWEALFRGSGFCLLNRSGEGNYTHLNLRRLATRSHTASDSPHATVWGWYFVDKSRKCLLYGSVGADKDSSNIDSTKLEKAYAKDPTGKINFATMSFNYEIDFKSMTQQNLSTKNKRDVIRRPLGSNEEAKKAQQQAARSSSKSPSPSRKSSLPTQSSLLSFRSSQIKPSS